MRKISPFFIGLLSIVLCCSSCGKIRSGFRYSMAKTAYNQGNYKKAISIYKELLKKNPKDPMLYWSLGIAYYSDGQMYRCQKQAVELRKLDKDDLAYDLEQLVERRQ